MKRLLTLTVLLLLFGLAFADTFVIGDGTSTTNYIPAYGFYDYGWSKMIYTASELTTAGYDGTDNITGIGFEVGNTPSSYTLFSQEVYIRHTTATAEDATYPDNTQFTQVFSGDVLFNGGGWHYVTFTTEFDWNGTDNIEILWENWDGDYASGYPNFRYTSTTEDMAVYEYADSTFPTTDGTLTTSRPNITILTPQVDPPNPAVLFYPADGGWAFLDGVLQWQDGGGLPTGYEVYLDTVDGSTLVSDGQPGTTYTPTLAAGTTYYWKVVPYNANGSATGCPVWSFSTPTADLIAESFEDTTFPPLGWTNVDGDFSRSTTSPFHGSAGAYEYISSSTTDFSLLYTPMLQITATSEIDWWMRTSYSYGNGRVQIVYSSDAVTWNDVGSEIVVPTETVWNNYNVDLGTLAGNNYYIGFKVYNFDTSNSSNYYIDHVIGPEVAAIVPDPVTLLTPADLATGLTLYPTFTWEPATTGGIPTGYRLYCDTNTDPTTLLVDTDGTSFTATTALAYSTDYHWKVVAYNATGDSTPNTVFSFSTGPDPTITTLPYTENFDGVTAPDLPYGWSKIVETTSTYPYVETYASTTYAVSPPNCVRMYNSSDSDADLRLISPPLGMDLNTLRLSFSARGTSGLDLLVGTMPSPGGDFTVFDTFSLTTTHTSYIVDFDTYTGTDQFIAFKHGQTTTYDYVYMDDVLLGTIPTGAPEHVTLVSPVDNATGVDPANTILDWDPSLTGVIPTLYGVFVGASPIDPGIEYWGEYYYETSESSLDLSAEDIPLGFNNTWYWAILPYNAEYASPDPSEPEFMVWQFTTAPDPTIVALPYEQYFDDVTAPEMAYGWTGYVNSVSTYAVAETYSSTTYAASPPNSVKMYNSSDTDADLRLITPQIDLGRSLSQIKLKFYARGSGTGDNVLLGTVDVPDGSGVFTMIDSLVLTTTQTEYTYSLADYTGTDQYICFKLGTGESYNYAYIDNVQMLELLANDLAATAISGPTILEAGTSYDFTIDVFNEGTATQDDYTVKLMSLDTRTELASLNVTDPLDPGATAQHVLSWTPTTGGAYPLYGQVVLTGDGNPANDETAPMDAYVIDSTMDLVHIGDDETTTSADELPISMYYKNGVTEELYFTDEMHLQSGTIGAIVYKNDFLNDLQDKPVKIWMAHTDSLDLNGGWLPETYTLVFDGTVDFPSGINYIVIPLDTPFSYTGGTLATRVNRPMDTVYHSTSDKFFYTDDGVHLDRSRYLRSDSTEYDPLAPSGTGTLLDYAPNTTFVVQNAVFEQQAELEGHVYVEGTTTPIEGATVTLSEGVSTTTDETGYYYFGLWETVTVDVTASMMDYYEETVTEVALTMGTTVTQDLYMTPLPEITVSGYVTSNDYPAGLEGATINLYGYHDYTTTSGVGGYFSLTDVKGSVDTLAYAWEVEKEGYETVSGSFDAVVTNVDLGTINLIEILYTPYKLTATHEGDNARLVWDPAGAPDYYFSDFESDDGGWVKSSNWTGTSLPNYPDGDWEWTNTYDVANYDDTGGSTGQLPPAAAYSGTGMWGTVINGPYSNCAVSGERSFLRQTFDLSIYDSPVLSVWHYMDGYNTWDYGQILVNGTPVWGTSDLAEFMPWQQIFVDLSAYSSLTEAEISFEWSSTTVSNYAGWYIDDVYIGSATTRKQVAQTFGTRDADRWFLDYDVFRLLPGDEGIPGNWTLLQAAYGDTTYLDTGFATLPEGAYKWAVQANYTTGTSEAIFSNVLGILNTPQDIAVTMAGADISLSWTAQPGATYYAVYAATDPYGTYTLLGYTDTASFIITSPAEQFEFYQVTACDGEMPSSKGMMPKSSK